MHKVTQLAVIEMAENSRGQVYYCCRVGGQMILDESLSGLLNIIVESGIVEFTLENIRLDRLKEV